MSAAIEPLATEAFQTNIVWNEDHVLLELSGNADLRVWRELGRLLKDMHAEILGRGLQRVVVDVTQLEFMNSSCFKSVVSWLTDIIELAPDHQYRVHFKSNPATLWQRRSLHALRSFALMIVSVE
ncbi:MAG: hypothetical protein KC731_11175 [Myxococcales bacterium]|nr:hypothetical protein [Myxococcales bacterium]